MLELDFLVIFHRDSMKTSHFIPISKSRPSRKAGEKSKILDEKKELVNFRVLLKPPRLFRQLFDNLGEK